MFKRQAQTLERVDNRAREAWRAVTDTARHHFLTRDDRCDCSACWLLEANGVTSAVAQQLGSAA